MKSIVLNFILVLCSSFAIAQSHEFKYRRALDNVTAEDWYSIKLPSEFFQKVNKDFSDIRLLAVTEKDTSEIPYLLRIKTDEIIIENFNLPLLNQSWANGRLFFTVQIPAGKMLNSLTLNFVEDNFDAVVSVEGSTDKKEWFEIVNTKRIVSIHQDNMDYSNTTINFPTSDYPYLRIQIKADKQLSLIGASFKHIAIKKGEHFILTDFRTTVITENKQTEIRLRAPYRTAVNSLAINTSYTNDYYRNYSLAYARDSIKTEKGWIQNYSTFKHGYLTSVDSNKIDFETLITHELKLTIYNLDNPALTINNIELSGPKIEIIANISPKQNSFLYYGSTKLQTPQYDLVHFENKIPPSVKNIALLDEENLEAPQPEKALFTKKFWLWTILIVVMGIMGYFTLQMLNRKD